jgi:hypothetical protein
MSRSSWVVLTTVSRLQWDRMSAASVGGLSFFQFAIEFWVINWVVATALLLLARLRSVFDSRIPPSPHLFTLVLADGFKYDELSNLP